MEKFVIIDGNAIIHRAYHALPPLTAKDGTMINAVYGFTSMLLKVLNDLKPEYLAVSFDVSGGTFRDEVFEGYKAKRIKADQELYDQIPLVYEIVKVFDIPIYIKKGFEADDVIATIVTRNKEQGIRNKNLESIIVTGDMDLLQLVDEKVKVYALRKGFSDVVMYDAEKVKEKYGFGPEHVVDYKALRGDPSDNIPGVSGIGEKTAKDLIEKIGGVDEIYKQLAKSKEQLTKKIKISVLKKLEEKKDDAEMSKKLATVVRDVPGLDFSLKNCSVKPFSLEKVSGLFKKFEFYSLLNRVPGYKNDFINQENNLKITASKKIKLQIIDRPDLVNDFLNSLKTVKEFSCREILSGNNIIESKLLGLVFVFQEKKYYVVWEKIDKNNQIKILEIFGNDQIELVGHDLKQLIKILQLNNIDVKNYLFDVMIASYLLNSSTRAHDLKSIVWRELKEDLPAGADQSSLFGVDPNIVATEMDLILQVKKKYKNDLEKMADFGLFEKIEMKLLPVLADMELNGIAVDKEMLKLLSVDVAKAIDKISQKIWKEAKMEFNISSSVQLREVLFEKLQLPNEGIKKGKTGYSTSASELEKMHGFHPIIEMIEEYRELEKLRNTYIDVLPTLINKKTNRIHTTFNQAVTTTGRLSSSDPNLQNIPIRTELGREIRKAFISTPGYSLVVADYSQIELRIVASLAKDKKMIEIFENGEDIHKATAAAINKIPLEQVTKEMRNAAKAVNFGVLYGMGAYGLAWRAGIPQHQAKEFIEKYFREFSGVKKYLDQTLEFAKKEGYVETLFGRRRYIPELKSDNYQLRSSGERMAINMPVQGTAADLMKMAMIVVHENIKILKHKNNLSRPDIGIKTKPGRDALNASVKSIDALNASTNIDANQNSDVKLILQVHDELVLEVKNGLEEEVCKIVKEAMENVVKLNVPVEVDVRFGKRWGEIK